MVSYKIDARHPQQHALKIEYKFVPKEERTVLQMPFWRPGRYEAGNFAKNIIGLSAHTKTGAVSTIKITSHKWELRTEPGVEITVSFDCYANELTAGNTYLDEELLLINPVNALVYALGFEDEHVELELLVKEDFRLVTALPENGKTKGQFLANGIQELFDTPILASAEIETLAYRIENTDFYIDLCGKGIKDRQLLKEEFQAFTAKQIEAFGGFPADRFRFLIILLPQAAYHGVEHETSTVIIIGPSADLDDRKLYKELIGVSSHELYHVWNVKSLRPADWTPYDFTKSNFSRLGYVAEGVTTYMGDKMLWLSGIFSTDEYLGELSVHLQRHMDNEGRHNLSLADASIDTWVDGYIKGTPRRRVSIYVEGALLALICDIHLLKGSDGEKTLDTAMKILHDNYGGQKGFTEEQYWEVLENLAKGPWESLYREVIDGKGKLEPYLQNALEETGLSIRNCESELPWEKNWGFSVQQVNGEYTVTNVAKSSPAERCGIWFGDKISSVNEKSAAEVFGQLESFPAKAEIKLTSGFRTHKRLVETGQNTYLQKFKIVSMANNQFMELWKKTGSDSEYVAG